MNESLRFAHADRLLRPLIVALVVLVLTVGGCNRNGESAKGGEAASADSSGGENNTNPDEVTLTPQAVQKYGIAVGQVQRRVLIPTFTAPVRVAFDAYAMAHIGSAVHGRIIKLGPHEGEAVKTGDELLVVESAELGEAQSDYLRKPTTLEVAQPTLKLAKDSYERARSLYEENKGIALTELQKREADFNAAEGNVRSARSAVGAAEDRLRLLGISEDAMKGLAQSGKINPLYSITTPIPGRVIEKDVTLGELVGPERSSLCTVADTSKLWVIADVPEAKLKTVSMAAKVRVVVPAISDAAIEGAIEMIGAALDANTRTAQVRVEVTNADGKLRPGMFCQAEFPETVGDGQAQPMLVVPDEAVQTVNDVTSVFTPVAGKQNTFTKRSVRVGKATGGLLPVLSGLKEGDAVVTKASFVLKAEMTKGQAED